MEEENETVELAHGDACDCEEMLHFGSSMFEKWKTTCTSSRLGGKLEEDEVGGTLSFGVVQSVGSDDKKQHGQYTE